MKLNKHDKMLDELVKAKTDLESKMISFDKRYNKILNANNNLEEKLESSNAKIIFLEAKIKSHETKIADLEAQKENVSPTEDTVDIRSKIVVLNNLIGKRPRVPENTEFANKRIKINNGQNLQSPEHPKDIQRVLNILSLASNLKEFFLPALTSDPKWNCEFEYVPDFSDIEVNQTNFLMECTYGSLHPIVVSILIRSSVVKVYQNPNISGFVLVDCEDKKVKFIYSFDSDNNKIKSEGPLRYYDTSRKLLGKRASNNWYSLSRRVSGEIFYKDQMFVDGKWKEQFSYKFDTNSLVWSKHK